MAVLIYYGIKLTYEEGIKNSHVKLCDVAIFIFCFLILTIADRIEQRFKSKIYCNVDNKEKSRAYTGIVHECIEN